MKTFRVGIIGATGTVGRKLIELLADHPWFEITYLCASERSAGKKLKELIPLSKREIKYETMLVHDLKTAFSDLPKRVDLVFCATNLSFHDTIAMETELAKSELVVVSNNSAHRFTPDVPMIIPEINPEHLEIIPYQRRRLNAKRGFIAVKSNCSVQSFLPAVTPLKKFGLEKVCVCTMQAISGAGKTLSQTPELQENLFPYIENEEEKLQLEPLKILGKCKHGKILSAKIPLFSAQCMRVPVEHGHTAAVSIQFKRKPTKEEILSAWKNFRPITSLLSLPSAPERFISYFTDKDRPQPRLDCEKEGGMGVFVGNLREDTIFDYKFTGLSHNLIRGAAGGAVLLAEFFAVKGYLD